MRFSPTSYQLVSVKSGKVYADTNEWTLSLPEESPSLIRAVYREKKLSIRSDLEGLYCFADWLPVKRTLRGASVPVTFRSTALADELGLNNLWITFSGWWPEKGITMITGTFKECEAYTVCARMGEHFPHVLVVASAGNTARAFAHVCSDNNIPLLLFVPQDNTGDVWLDKPLADCVKLVCPAAGGDYYDAIRMSEAAVAGSSLFIAEGGAKNIARRDGMGTTVLSAAVIIGRIPDVYFQAVGSGTGAIAAWEAAMRLAADGRFGKNSMRLVVSQNEPFTPMADSWNADSRNFIVKDDESARKLAGQVNAKVLTNRRPPWAIPGGLYDALKSTGGSILTASNEEAFRAGERFAELEGCDITPAASVAVASLFDSVKTGKVGKDEVVMLNVTGGGVRGIKEHGELHHIIPEEILPLDSSDESIVEICEKLFN